MTVKESTSWCTEFTGKRLVRKHIGLERFVDSLPLSKFPSPRQLANVLTRDKYFSTEDLLDLLREWGIDIIEDSDNVDSDNAVVRRVGEEEIEIKMEFGRAKISKKRLLTAHEIGHCILGGIYAKNNTDKPITLSEEESYVDEFAHRVICPSPLLKKFMQDSLNVDFLFDICEDYNIPVRSLVRRLGQYRSHIKNQGICVIGMRSNIFTLGHMGIRMFEQALPLYFSLVPKADPRNNQDPKAYEQGFKHAFDILLTLGSRTHGKERDVTRLSDPVLKKEFIRLSYGKEGGELDKGEIDCSYSLFSDSMKVEDIWKSDIGLLAVFPIDA